LSFRLGVIVEGGPLKTAPYRDIASKMHGAVLIGPPCRRRPVKSMLAQ